MTEFGSLEFVMRRLSELLAYGNWKIDKASFG